MVHLSNGAGVPCQDATLTAPRFGVLCPVYLNPEAPMTEPRIPDPSPLIPDEESDEQPVCAHCGYAVPEGESMHPACQMADAADRA